MREARNLSQASAISKLYQHEGACEKPRYSIVLHIEPCETGPEQTTALMDKGFQNEGFLKSPNCGPCTAKQKILAFTRAGFCSCV